MYLCAFYRRSPNYENKLFARHHHTLAKIKNAYENKKLYNKNVFKSTKDS